jgi:hypothetical protein
MIPLAAKHIISCVVAEGKWSRVNRGGSAYLTGGGISLRLDAHGSEWDPVILPVFKTGARHLRGVEGVFDSHTLPPLFSSHVLHIATLVPGD